MGLQAPGPCDTLHGAVARHADGEVDRVARPSPAEGAAADDFSSRPKTPPRHALVRADGPAGVVARMVGVRLPRPPTEERPDSRRVLGRASGSRGNSTAYRAETEGRRARAA